MRKSEGEKEKKENKRKKEARERNRRKRSRQIRRERKSKLEGFGTMEWERRSERKGGRMVEGERRESEGARKVKLRKGARRKEQEWYSRREEAREMGPKRRSGEESVNGRAIELNAEYLDRAGPAKVGDNG